MSKPEHWIKIAFIGMNDRQIAACHNYAEEYAASVGKAPIDMVLYCPNCGMQHIDKPEPCKRNPDCDETGICYGNRVGGELQCDAWKNPPHRSHLCANPECQMVWRPADVPTNGVASTKTYGKADAWVPYAGETLAEPACRAIDKIEDQ